MSAILTLLDPLPTDAEDTWVGPASGPEGKRSYGGQFVAQSVAAACRTVDADRPPTNEAGEPVEYTVTRVFDGRTAAARRVDSRQGGRLLTTATVSFATELPGPEHGRRSSMPHDPGDLPQTGPAGPAPSMPLDDLDIRIADDTSDGEFTRRMWWRTTAAGSKTRQSSLSTARTRTHRSRSSAPKRIDWSKPPTASRVDRRNDMLAPTME